MIVHPIEPLYSEQSEILILGSFPSVKSREQGFYYGHPQNRFWRVLAGIYGADTPKSIDEKKAFIIDNKLALWDVIHSCEIEGSSDSSIKNVVPNDLSVILENSSVRRIFVNGRKAETLYKRYLEAQTGITATPLPSTSPANAAFSEERLVSLWKSAILPENDATT